MNKRLTRHWCSLKASHWISFEGEHRPADLHFPGQGTKVGGSCVDCSRPHRSSWDWNPDSNSGVRAQRLTLKHSALPESCWEETQVLRVQLSSHNFKVQNVSQTIQSCPLLTNIITRHWCMLFGVYLQDNKNHQTVLWE